jgi:hypothetical protein
MDEHDTTYMHSLHARIPFNITRWLSSSIHVCCSRVWRCNMLSVIQDMPNQLNRYRIFQDQSVVTEIPSCYGTQRFIIIIIIRKSYHWTLFWVSWIHFSFPNNNLFLLRSILISSDLQLTLPILFYLLLK